MNTIDKKIVKEIKNLNKSGSLLLKKIQLLRTGISGKKLSEVTTWVIRLGHLIRQLYSERSQHFEAYKSALETKDFYTLHSNYNGQFAQMVGIGKTISHDIENGLIDDFKAIVQADIFADFLEMGEYLLNEGYKDAAAVIIGSVLEDGLRKLTEKNGLPLISDSGKKLTIDPLNTELAKKNIYSKLVQKQIISWADIRNNAAHGNYSEYSKEQIKLMLLGVQSFTSDYLT